MDLSQVTLTQMRYAVAVAEAHSFRAAAQASHVSQSGLSMQIQKLEELLGIRLFDRSRKPVLITDEGQPALEQLRTILRETQRLSQLLAEGNEPAGPFRLAVIPTLSATVLPLVLGDFIATYPRVELSVEELETKVMIERLQGDQLDAGIAATPLSTPGLSETPLGLESFLAYLSPGDPLLAKASLRQRDLEDRELWVMPEGHCFRSQVLTYCSAAHLRKPKKINFESASFETLIRLVDAGLGATILPELVAQGLPPERQAQQLRPLTAPRPVREIGLVRARAQLRRRSGDALVLALKAALKTALGPTPRRPQILDPLPESH